MKKNNLTYMKHMFVLLLICFTFFNNAMAQETTKKSKNNFNQLTKEEENVIVNKGTEAPFSGKLLDNKEKGVYVCKRCDAILYESNDKFDSHCGWPSFDDEIKGAVKRQKDSDGIRTEILCARCGAHLGHVFDGEGLTIKDTRHCVNSISIKFVKDGEYPYKKAYFASGCFWGTQYQFDKNAKIERSFVGYMGGSKPNPTYIDVCTGKTGNLETLEVLYNPKKVKYEDLVKIFFETHDFTQVDGQGPDIGSQYLSAIFYSNDEEKEMAQKYINILESKGNKVATKLIPVSTFWPAEEYHQKYYEAKGGEPYCHSYKKIF